MKIVTPQFTRPKGEPEPAQPPSGKAGFDALKVLSDEELLRLGMRQWGREHEDGKGNEWGSMLWLFPGEWYDSLPEGYLIVSIDFKSENFRRGKTDDDIRFGCLAYGILR